METQLLLLLIWVVLGVLIFILGVLNAVSIMTLETRLNQLDSQGGKTVWSIIISNWDIFVAGLLVSIFGLSFIFSNTRAWYNDNKSITFLIAFFVLGISMGVIAVKRI